MRPDWGGGADVDAQDQKTDGRSELRRSPPMIRQDIRSFEEFWPHYLGEHLDPVNRALHFTGTTLVYAAVALAVLRSPLWLAAAPVLGYGFAWVGHFFVEKNRPATFSYPLWSLRGDFRMHARMLTASLHKDLERAVATRAA